MERFKGKVALVTGGTCGIGAATVRRLAEEGARVVFTGRNAQAGEQVAEAHGAHFHRHDVDDRAGWDTLMAAIRERFGRLDIAFANSGIEGATPISSRSGGMRGTRSSPSISPGRCSPPSMP